MRMAIVRVKGPLRLETDVSPSWWHTRSLPPRHHHDENDGDDEGDDDDNDDGNEEVDYNDEEHNKGTISCHSNQNNDDDGDDDDEDDGDDDDETSLICDLHMLFFTFICWVSTSSVLVPFTAPAPLPPASPWLSTL